VASQKEADAHFHPDAEHLLEHALVANPVPSAASAVEQLYGHILRVPSQQLRATLRILAMGRPSAITTSAKPDF
jgi:hypothetical protein